MVRVFTPMTVRSTPPQTVPTIRGKTRLPGSLTLRILAVNLLAPLVLLVGLLYMDQYRENLVHTELETLKIQVRLLAGGFAEGASARESAQNGILIPEAANRMLRVFSQGVNDRIQLFDDRGFIVGDSGPLPGLDAQEAGGFLRGKNYLALYPATASEEIADYPDAKTAIQGGLSVSGWQTRAGNFILTAAAPVRKDKNILGVVLVTKDGRNILDALAAVRFGVLTAFLGALSMTIFMSLYLAGIIGRPLKKLADAAEAVRLGRGRQIDIPDLSHRRDEIGELSAALRDMTQALRDRMDTIGQFAADVAHEIKNPLTSLRSAVETLGLVSDKEDKDRLMAIIKHDIVRMDRLISDISDASRLDAELSREEMGEADLAPLLKTLIAAPERREKIVLNLPEGKKTTVRGIEGRLAQVFENLIGNALSFSPPQGTIALIVSADKNLVTVRIEDKGPGIPEDRLETIFERFYTERPRHEDYGEHSGLGLSIARQIVEAHGGLIRAENIRDAAGSVQGARFTVILNAA